MNAKRAGSTGTEGAIAVFADSVTLQLAAAGVALILLGSLFDAVGFLGTIMPAILVIWGAGLALIGAVAYAVIWYNKPT